LTLAVLLPGSAQAADSNADAWEDAREVQRSHAAAIATAAKALADGGNAEEISELRRLVREALRAMDQLDVRACFRVWWSYVRTSYVLYDQALAGLEDSDLARVRTATLASTFLASMAASTAVDCSRSGEAFRRSSVLGPRGGLPVVGAEELGRSAG
jgi:hypothetical protein